LGLWERARLDGSGAVSTQVLQEYFVVATRKLGVPAGITRRKVEIISRLGLVILGLRDILAAIDLHRLHGIGFWDALIIQAARQADCRVLYSEDLQHERSIEGLRIINPFEGIGAA
jgi:predicted nucleic acid-binding protein